MWVLAMALLLGTGQAVSTGTGQSVAAAKPVQGPETTLSQGTGDDQDYHIGPGDLIRVTVYGIDGLDAGVRVSNSGKIHLAHLGILHITNMTPAGLEKEVASRLRALDLVTDPSVQVRVVEYRAHPVYILGEIMTPGMFVMRDKMYLSDLVVLGQGFNEHASPVGYLYRRKPVDETSKSPEDGSFVERSVLQQAIEVNFKDLMEGKDPSLNVQLRGGDILYVPEKRQTYFFVVGAVLRPGLYQLPPDGTVLSRAVAEAGGPAKTAKLSGGLLVHYDGKGGRREVPFDLRAVMEGKEPDPAIRLNDVIFIPGSTAKTVGYGILGVIPGVVSGKLIVR